MDAVDPNTDPDLHTLVALIGIPRRTIQRWMSRGAIEFGGDSGGYRTLFPPRGVLQAQALRLLRSQGVNLAAAIARVAPADIQTLRGLVDPSYVQPNLPMAIEAPPVAVIELPQEPVVPGGGVAWRCHELVLGVELSVRDDAGAEARRLVAEILARYKANALR